MSGRLLTALLTLAALPALADDALVAEGRRLYRDGLRADGRPLEGRRPGGGVLRGRDMACVQCHRQSGMGTVEGLTLVPPIIGTRLFSPGRPPAGHQPRRAAGMALDERPSHIRPAYDAALLARALRDGIGAGGASFEPTMPRYALTDRELAALSAYLNHLGTVPQPGIDASTIHLATVIAPDTDARQQGAMLDVLRQCIAEHSPRPGNSRPAWQLHEWRLAGPPAGWPAQLADFQRRQPAFALVAGIGREWAPVHRYCEAENLPCLFPNTDAPGPAPHASVYLSPGLALEGRVAVQFLRDQPRPVRRLVQVFSPRDIGRHGATAAAAALPTARRVDLAPGAPLPALADGDALLLWLTPAELADFAKRRPKLPAGVPVLVSASLAELDRTPDAGPIRTIFSNNLRVIYPFDETNRRLARMVFNLGGWMNGHGLALARDTERVQGNTWSACAVTAQALYTLPAPPSREALLERVEDTYGGAVSTAFPRFTLGPGQRYGSKGAYLMRVATDGTLETDGEWIVP